MLKASVRKPSKLVAIGMEVHGNETYVIFQKVEGGHLSRDADQIDAWSLGIGIDPHDYFIRQSSVSFFNADDAALCRMTFSGSEAR